MPPGILELFEFILAVTRGKQGRIYVLSRHYNTDKWNGWFREFLDAEEVPFSFERCYGYLAFHLSPRCHVYFSNDLGIATEEESVKIVL